MMGGIIDVLVGGGLVGGGLVGGGFVGGAEVGGAEDGVDGEVGPSCSRGWFVAVGGMGVADGVIVDVLVGVLLGVTVGEDVGVNVADGSTVFVAVGE